MVFEYASPVVLALAGLISTTQHCISAVIILFISCHSFSFIKVIFFFLEQTNSDLNE